ncbi:MAG: transcriptional regulator BetI [Pseudomonadota bacterium]
MPKLGMEPKRKAALIDAAIAEIAATRSLDVTVGRIAQRAGMSTALAHHYFGSKDRILIEAMRGLLRALRREHLHRLARAETPRARLSATIQACFAPDSFQPGPVAAWLAFYVHAQSSDAANRLLRLYQRRLRANLRHDLRPLTPDPLHLADTIAALIDGHYLREARQDRRPDPAAVTRAIETATDLLLQGPAR